MWAEVSEGFGTSFAVVLGASGSAGRWAVGRVVREAVVVDPFDYAQDSWLMVDGRSLMVGD